MTRKAWLHVLLWGILISSNRVHADTPIVTQTIQDGAYLATSPLRLTKEDLPIGIGAAALLGGGFALDRLTRRNLYSHQNDPWATDLRRYGDVAQFSGLIFGAGFAVHYLATDDEKSKETAWLAAESLGWASGFEEIGKVVAGRERPSATDNPFEFKMFSSNASFPSGHTTAAFAAADVFAEQYPTWTVIAPVYVAATAVGVSRLYANQHWASDVIAGALLGTAVSHTLRKRRRHAGKGWNFTANTQGIQIVRQF
jgi:membrane-associated phospholipid phosphatase